MSDFAQFAYAVQPASGLDTCHFERTLVQEVFPEVQVLRRDVRGIQNVLVKLPAINGHPDDYLWLVELDVYSSNPAPPELEELAAKLGSLGTVEPRPFASVFLDLDRNRAVIRPNSVKVPSGERMVWSFLNEVRGHRPFIDFFSFQAPGDVAFSDISQPPFEELTSRRKLITSGGAGGTMIISGGATGPNGRYWYEISLVPGRRAPGNEVVRLECDPWPEGQPGGRRAAAVEISDPPARPTG